MMPSELPLRDIHLPEAISLLPSLSTCLIAVSFFCVLSGMIYFIFKHLTRKTALKTAKKQLAQIKRNKTQTNAEKLLELSALLRRVAMSVSGRENCASLTGAAWLNYLDKSLKTPAFSQGVGQCLADINYRQNPIEPVNLSELILVIEKWLKAQKIHNKNEK